MPAAIKGIVSGFCFVLLGAAAVAENPQYSALWGRNGERWEAAGRLPDFSYAGYHRGERPLPDLSTRERVSVKQFGAKGDGTTDDTEAFRRALDDARGRVVFVPSGRYRITDILRLDTSGTVLKGEGADSSILFFPKPLNEIRPNWSATTTGRRTSNYSWSGGFIHVAGSFSRRELAEVTREARRGDRSLVVSDGSGLKVGDFVRLVLKESPSGSLVRELYAGDPGRVDNLKGRTRESFVFRVAKIEASEGRIHSDRPLRTDVRLEWKPTLFPAQSSTEEVGVEHLGFEFPATPYRGHFTEVGFNALAMSGVRNCWARDLRILNSDSGLFIGGVNVTLHGIRLESERKNEPSRRATGHHGITLGGQDNLLTRFDIRTRFMHDITVTRGSAGNVASGGRGVDLALDHHRYGPHSNLFTDIDLGAGTRMFQSGGGAKLGRHSAAHETFWCVRARRSQVWPQGWGPDRMNFVGVESGDKSVTDVDGRWFEAIAPGSLRPRDLHRAQLKLRLKNRASAPAGGGKGP